MIKPSVPTPNHLRNMRISFIDHSFFPASVVALLYYPANGGTNDPVENLERRTQLAKSLSETLTLFYPIAGRYMKEDYSINCNDDGVEYVEALVDGELSQILQGEVEAKELNRFVPEEVEESSTRPLIAIQINIFNCGGLAIGFMYSHRIMDCFTFSMFINGWAKIHKVGVNDVDIPDFESAGILFPARELSWNKLPEITNSETVTKRFLFDAETISKLKAEAMSGCGFTYSQPSTVEVMTALIWRAQINAIRARYGHLKTSMMSMPMNLRGRTFEKIPENCCGNFFTMINAKIPANDSKMGLNDFVDLVRDAIRNSITEFAQPSEGEDGFFSKVMKPFREFFEELGKKDGDLILFSSWRHFPLYEVDFGWGKPAWVSFVQSPYKGIVFIDKKCGDGIEIWVTLDVEDMAHFQQDPNIINFSS
ncbi:hypothetical protein LWI29_023460 [Acer saccharum]|uniref:Uncharacterized protein n=1 Tax=Acer saccharum TaxID=4024 RepID=A0AA39RX55_ACESA|nr:hypothetical protein LWI29_023460 [Acer saccharum]